MRRRRRADDHGIDAGLVYEILVRSVSGAAHRLGGGGCSLRPDVGHAGPAPQNAPLQCLDIGLGDGAGADQTQAQGFGHVSVLPAGGRAGCAPMRR